MWFPISLPKYYRRAKADPMNFWFQEHNTLSFAVMLWEMALGNDPRLRNMMDWAHEGKDIYIYKIRRNMLENIDFQRFEEDDSYKVDCTYSRIIIPPYYQGVEKPVPWREYFKDNLDAKKVAVTYIQQEIKNKLEEYPLKLSFRKERGGELCKVLEPTSLLSAMWYQFFLAQTGDINLRRCSLCGKWENMEGHRSTWSKHANCANYGRVKRARYKKKADESK
jgi:hypothetical protein